LRIEKRVEIAMIYARMRSGGDGGFGVVGDAEAGLLQHGEIVGAVADRQRLGVLEAEA
jgi:hypothetical protein